MQWANSKYGWLLGHVVRRYAAGTALVAEQGSEFDCLPESFRTYVYAAAAVKGHRASAMVIGRSVVYAFYKPSDLMRPNLPAYPVVKKMRRG